MTSKIRKNPPLEGSKPPKSAASSHTSSNRTGEKKKLIKTESNLDGNNNSKVGNLSSNNKTPMDKEMEEDDKGARIAAAMKAQLQATSGDGDTFSDGYVYKDPAPLKWRIFEAVAKTNGQRAFATYWSTLRNFLRGWIPRSELDEELLASLGAENVHLHNELILCLINNSHCRYIPAELIDQVPPSFRDEVVQCERRPEASPEPPPPTNPLPSAKVPLSFQGKRKEGLLSPKAEMDCGYTSPAAQGAGSAVLKWGGGSGVVVPRQEAPAGMGAAAAREGGSHRCTGMSGGLSLSSASPADVKNGSGSWSGGDMASAALEKPLAGAKPTEEVGWEGGVLGLGEAGGEKTVGAADEFSEERLLFEIESHFGAGSDVWQPWSDGLDDEQQISGRKRAGSPEAWPADSEERTSKSPKSHQGALASAGASAGVSRAGTSGSPGGNFSAVTAPDQAVQSAPSYRSQRVPGARSLAPYLQALTASQQMKVSHEVCRVMTTGVKEYLRRILEACLATAREGKQGRAKPLSGVVKANGATAPESLNAGDTGVNGERPVITPAHLRAALEASPRLAGPLSSSKVQWRRVAMFAVDKPSPVPPRGVSYSHCYRGDRVG